MSSLRLLAGTDDDPARIALALAKDPAVDVRLRIDCALGLVPFVHAKLSYSESSNTQLTVRADSASVLQELEDRLSRIRRPILVIDEKSAEPDAQSEAVEAQNGSFRASSAISPEAVSASCPLEAAE